MEVGSIDIGGTKLAIATTGQGRPIVFLHGSEGIGLCGPLLKSLSTYGSVIAPSHPGFGATARPIHFRTVDDLAYFYLELLEHLGIEDALLIGANFGAWIAAEIAVRNSTRISALVLASPVGARFTEDQVAVEIQDIFTMESSEERRRTWVMPEQHVKEHASLSDAEILSLVKDRETLNHFSWAPYMHSPLLSRWLHRIKTPTMVVLGESDGITSLAYGTAYAASIAGARLEVVLGAAHMPHIEQTSKFSQLVASFSPLQEHANA